jgi:hypothetical protein
MPNVVIAHFIGEGHGVEVQIPKGSRRNVNALWLFTTQAEYVKSHHTAVCYVTVCRRRPVLPPSFKRTNGYHITPWPNILEDHSSLMS